MRARETRVKSGGLRRPVHSAPALFFSLFVFTAGAANAHEYCLLPSAWNAMPGDTITFGAVVGEGFGGERKPYAPGRVVRLIAHTARELDLTPVARAGDTVWARFTPVDRGGLLIACESNFATITLDAEKFDRYLADEGLDGPLASRRARRDSVPGRERYRRCAKTWLGGEAADRVTRPVGLPLEIVPLESPGTPDTGRPLRVKVLFEGRPLVGALLKAWRQSPGAAGNPHPEPGAQSVPIWSGRTDAWGEAVVPAGPPGSYLISTVHMIASRVASAADWESTWASLTFGGGSDPR